MNFMFNLEDYETVEVRLEKFIKDFPDFRVETELVSFTNDRYIVKAWIYRTFADSTPFSSGLAEETISSRGVNATSALENCETSAIGRALANAGYASKGKRPSKEEMVKVTRAKFAQPKQDYIAVVKEDDPWTIKTVAMPTTSAEAVATVKDIIGGTTDKDIPNCLCGKPRILRTGTAKTGKQWAAWDCPFKASNYQVGQQKACEPDRVWLELNANGQWQPQKVRA
jgi:Tfp pilus assembly major pilin PilA